ncbi:unnamed protein product [Paramecium octaurelia]|uniref:Uncharacterized protein n=1 Tax=Paramecium octaurelia TaxID=43137 RepID=A0A8S1XT91_PAROT|nr:unnamed protein product [Paramecium octaurelia]
MQPIQIQALDEYVEKFEKNFQNLKKYCGMDELIESLKSENKNIVSRNQGNTNQEVRIKIRQLRIKFIT